MWVRDKRLGYSQQWQQPEHQHLCQFHKLEFPEGDMKNFRDARQWLVVQEKSLAFQESKSFTSDSEPAWFLPERGILFILLDSKQTCLFSQRRHYLCFASVFPVETSLKKQARTKLVLPPLIQKHERPMENCLPICLLLHMNLTICLSNNKGFLFIENLLLNSKLSEGEWKILCC